MNKFIVFGANGFIGSSIVDELSKEHLVVAVDRYTRKPGFKKNPNVRMMEVDITRNSDALISQRNINGVVWAIGGVIPADTIENKEILELIRPTIQILEVFMKRKVPIIIISSAGMLYKPQKRVLTENSMVEPWTWYGLQKQILEKSLTLLSNEYGNNDFTIFRVTSVYGERQPTNRNQGVVGKLVRSSLLGEVFPLYGSSQARRDYVYVKDLAKIINLALKKKLKYKIYNISSGKSASLSDLKKQIESITKIKIEIERKNKREIDPNSIEVSNKRLMKEIKNFKFTDIKEGLNSTVNWFKKNL